MIVQHEDQQPVVCVHPALGCGQATGDVDVQLALAYVPVVLPPAPCCTARSSPPSPRPAAARRRTTACSRPSPARTQRSCTAGLRRIPARRAPAQVRFHWCPPVRQRPGRCRGTRGRCTCSRPVAPHLGQRQRHGATADEMIKTRGPANKRHGIRGTWTRKDGLSGTGWINPHTGTCACQGKHKGVENRAVQRACHLPMGCGSNPTKSALVGWCGGSLQRTHEFGADWNRVRGAHTRQ